MSNQAHDSAILEFGVSVDYNPKHPQFYEFEDRLKTFNDWPIGVPQDIINLVDAGFFYSGISDKVICYYCNGELQDWVSSDEPWILHAKWYPFCIYLICKKGRSFINFCLEEKPVHDVTALLCKICLNNQLEIITFPCRHVAMCISCKKQMKFCPICNCKIKSLLHIYLK